MSAAPNSRAVRAWRRASGDGGDGGRRAALAVRRGHAGGRNASNGTRETIRRLIAALPEPFREAIVLREINDLSYREIADVVGAPVGTVMSRLARARAHAARRLAKAEAEETTP